MSRAPRVSVVIPTFRSEATVGGCLEALRRQRYRDFETIVVDSSPDRETDAILRRYPEIRHLSSHERLLPHAARNRGVAIARGDLLVFTDPDIYPEPGWLGALVRRHDRTGQAVVSTLACHGDRWLDQGIHLVKFSKWLPGAARGTVDNAPTAGVLYTRRLYDRLGGFDDALMAGDTLFSWGVLDSGSSLEVEPDALASHHHASSLGGFLRERFVRGLEYGSVRAEWGAHGRGRDLCFLLVSALPVRWSRAVLLVGLHCVRSRRLGTFLRTLPVVVAGHGASLAGESLAYARRLAGRRSRRGRRGPGCGETEAPTRGPSHAALRRGMRGSTAWGGPHRSRTPGGPP